MRSIPRFHGFYATNEGHILSTRRGVVSRLTERRHKGYLHVVVREGVGRSSKKKVPVHRLVLLAYHGEPAHPSLVGRHLDGNPLDNRPENLAWGTVRDNIADSIRHGTAVCLRLGEEAPGAKLSNDQVSEIRSLRLRGVGVRIVADRFGVSDTHVRHIEKQKTRVHG